MHWIVNLSAAHRAADFRGHETWIASDFLLKIGGLSGDGFTLITESVYAHEDDESHRDSHQRPADDCSNLLQANLSLTCRLPATARCLAIDEQ